MFDAFPIFLFGIGPFFANFRPFSSIILLRSISFDHSFALAIRPDFFDLFRVTLLKVLAALKLKVNSSETQCMFVTNQRTRLPETITIDGIRIEIKDSVKVLGVTLDNKLRFSSFVNSTCAKSYYHLRRITSIRKYLSFDLTKLLILTFVISRLDYCNSLLYGAPDYMIEKLQRVQNRAACLLFHQRNSNVNILLNELNDGDCKQEQ